MKPFGHLYYVENIIKVLEGESDVLFAFLFGSYAKGTHDHKSDIDIAVYLKDENILERVPLYPSRLAIKIERALDEKKTVDVCILNGSTLRFKSQVHENIRLIEEIRSQGYESFSKSFRDIQAAKHALQESIEACLDIGSHIIAEKGFRRAEDLVHRYAKIDKRRLFIIMSEDLTDIQEFAKKILMYIS